ncbi:MAG: DEAD/DEAH box helicase [Candidatus Babeliaceae bacterium]|jgi:superfamily II DNA/RNA helicase
MAHYKSNRPNSTNRRYGGGSGRSQSARAVKKFDPSLFIKKVEEKVISETYVPKNTFSDFAIEPRLKENIINKGYTLPTPIQDQAIPFLLEGRDIIATANTGTGKTAAFLIPLINNVLTDRTSRVLIIAPTRELAGQIESEFKAFSNKMGLTSVLCIGGTSVYNQTKDFRRNPEFVIGTPGRLMDLEQNQVINFGQYTSIVLDEVDRMLDMGFINDIRYIIDRLPRKRHSLFFSATIPANINNVMDTFLHNPVSISVKTRQSAENVNQDIIKIGSKNKIDVLHDVLIAPGCTKSIIFVRTKRAADRLAKALAERGFDVASIHGDKTQAQRNKALSLFKNNKVKILLATDVVARGIDIDDISHVINYDLPQTHEDYIHRIGRTGRAGKIGQAITFID